VDGIATAVWEAVLLTLLNSLFAEVVSVSDDEFLLQRARPAAGSSRLWARQRTEAWSAGRPDRRTEPARPAAGASGRPGAHAWPVACATARPPSPVDRLAPAHDARQPGGHPARSKRRNPRVSLVREGEQSVDGGQPSGRRGRDRPPHQRWHGSAGRRRGERRQSSDRRCCRAGYLTMATIAEGASTDDERRLRGLFVTTVDYIRLLVLMVGEMAKELYQAERQRARSVEPRMHRDLHFALERAVTNVALRTVSTASSSRRCTVRRRPSTSTTRATMPSRTTAALSARSDRRAQRHRPGHRVADEGRLLRPGGRIGWWCLSDHGQCLGATFQQRNGEPLEPSSPRCCLAR